MTEPMTEPARGLDDRLTLGEVLQQRGVPSRDCRDCSRFDADPQGRGFGWCQAHDMYVKLYHADEDWHSQCQFKAIRLVREVRPGRVRQPEGARGPRTDPEGN